LFSFSTLSFFKHTIIEREKTKKARAQREREREREGGREMEDTESKFKRVCVFCGSSSGKKASYQEAAVELAKELVIVFIYVYTHTHFISAHRYNGFLLVLFTYSSLPFNISFE
jgi:hypothetical protein